MHHPVKQVLDRYLLAPLKRYSLPALLFVVLTILGVLLWRYLEWWEIASTLPAKDRIQLENEALRTIAQVFGGIFFLITAYFTYRTVRATERNVITSQEGQITERFTKAIEQLGNKEKLEVRLGGIYALERIARDSAKDHWPIMEVLTAYVRENAPRKENENDQQPTRPATDIQAILSVLARRTLAHERQEEAGINLSKTDLAGVYLPYITLVDTDLREANLRNATLHDANLQLTTLGEADLQKASLQRVQLQQTNLVRTNFQGADLWDAQFRGAVLWDANLQGADLRRADLSDAALQRANFRGANLQGASVQGSNLQGADLQGADLSESLYNNKTRWPEGFTPPADAINTDA